MLSIYRIVEIGEEIGTRLVFKALRKLGVIDILL
jgi:hypothetical protein